MSSTIISPLFFDAEIYFIAFGLITIFGGVFGYLKARSIPSLVAGGIAGLLLVVGALLLPRLAAWVMGASLCLVVSLLLVGRFLPSLFRGKLNPALYVVPLGIIGAILAGVLLFGAGGHP